MNSHNVNRTKTFYKFSIFLQKSKLDDPLLNITSTEE